MIKKRANRLSNFETKVKSTRVVIGSDISTQGEKARLLSENKHLIDLAFQQEQISIVERSKLRILHDFRDLCKYTQYVQEIIEGKNIDFNFEEEEIKSKKKQIENLRKAIEYEKLRIYSMQTPQFGINEAAIMIQKHWRGFYQRQQEEKNENNEANDEIEYEAEEIIEFDSYQDSPCSNEYSDDVDRDTEDAGVFNVTGVANAVRESEDDDDFKKIAPADALASHKNKELCNIQKVSIDMGSKKSPKRNNTARNDEKIEETDCRQVKQRKIKDDKKIKTNIVSMEKMKNCEDQKESANIQKNNKKNENQNESANIQENNKKDEVRNIGDHENTADDSFQNSNILIVSHQSCQKSHSPLNIKTYMSD